ncbi:hypothetical protein MMC07_004297 [Pseudocyphellaria aurata]|nr:hypothetical protein [Pseudocyphellaria aurata]
MDFLGDQFGRLSLSSKSSKKNGTTTNTFSALPAEIHARIPEQCGFYDQTEQLRVPLSLERPMESPCDLFDRLSVRSNSSKKNNTITDTFSALPAEIHVRIAEQCGFYDRYNLCRTSKLMKERCLHVLYRDVDLERDRQGSDPNFYGFSQKYDYLIRTFGLIECLDNHPEYGKHIRFFKGSFLFGDSGPYLRQWRTMESLTHVKRVEIGSRKFDNDFLSTDPSWQPPCNLFQSATSVTLVGHLEYKLAKSILGAIDPEKLRHLCLDIVQEPNLEWYHGFKPGDISEDGRTIAYGATSGLLTTLTGRCKTIRTLILRRRGQIQDGREWNAVAEDASYMEWASFLSSVQSTVESFTFAQARSWKHTMTIDNADSSSRIMDNRFRRLVLPTIFAGYWPCLKTIELQGVRSPYGEAQLTMELRAVLGGDTTIVIKERPFYVEKDGMINEHYHA